MSTVAVLGNLSLDRIDGAAPRIGGGPYHAARALRAVARPASVVVKFGRSDREALLPRLAGIGLPVTWRAGAVTAAFRIDHAGEERSMQVEAVGDRWAPEEVPAWIEAALAHTTHLHVAPLTRADFPAPTLAALARKRRLSLDGQGLVRVPREGPLELDADYDPALLEHISILKLSEEEARVLVGSVDGPALASLGVPEVVVTLGSSGSLVVTAGGVERIPTRRLAPTVDPTGAGDAFAAAYLVARSGGFAPAASARWASGVVAGLLGRRIR